MFDKHYVITEYILNHKEGIVEHINNLSNDSKYNPIIKEFYRDAVVEEVVSYLTGAMGLNYEDVAGVVDYEYLLKLLGEEFFRV